MIRKGFFSPTEITSRAPLGLLPQCGKCGLYGKCRSPKMPLTGQGKKGILLVGEAPGAEEDKQNRQFVGETGQYLQQVLSRLGVDMRQDCWLFNALSCRPSHNATPTEKQITYCRPKVVEVIKELKPTVIVLLGGSAVKSVLSWLWKDNVGVVSRWVGWQIPSQQLNAWVCPTFHPSHIKRSENARGQLDLVLESYFAQHLEAATSKRRRPWKEIPDYRSQVKVELCPSQASQYLKAIAQMNRPLAFDFETEGLKPDGGHLAIVSCAVSNGTVTVAYPWQGQAIKASKELIFSPLPKIGANIKYEERWSRQHLGKGVKNWVFDTVVAAHVLDNRAGICSLKFQSFVLLGQQPYDDHIKPYLKGIEPGGYACNRVREVDWRQLLIYNGLDALLELEVAKIQSRKLGLDLFAPWLEAPRKGV